MADSEVGQCSGEEAGRQSLRWRLAPGSGSHWWSGFLTGGRLGASGLLSGVGVVPGGKRVTEVLRGFSAVIREALRLAGPTGKTQRDGVGKTLLSFLGPQMNKR